MAEKQSAGMEMPASLAPSQDTEIAVLKAELHGLTALVRSVLAAQVGVPAEMPTPPPLESHETERDRILKAWDAEPRVVLMIPPDETDKNAAKDLARRMGHEMAYPPRTFQVNGVQLHVPVGEATTVPASIAALYMHTINPYQARGIAHPVTFDQAEARLGLG